jgi:hypothetical protein
MIDLYSSGKGIPFVFQGAYYPKMYSKLKASNLVQLAGAIEKADKYSIFYHIFHPIFTSHLVAEDLPNDFAVWIDQSLGLRELAEKIADIPGAEPRDAEDVRKELIEIINSYKSVREGLRPFVFVSCYPIVYDTGKRASTLAEFLDTIATIDPRAVVWHFVSKRILGMSKKNDFSAWLEENFGLTDVASKLSIIDPQTYTDEERLRDDIIQTLEGELL